MQRPHALLGVVSLATVFATGCEFDDQIAFRTQEKSAVYANLQPWEKDLIANGSIAKGFTTDMVYMAMGQPTNVETKTFSDAHAEMWTYRQYYPNHTMVGGFHYDSAPFTTESAYQPSPPPLVRSASGRLVPRGMGLPQSIGLTGPPQGSMEPADLQSYTCWVVFRDGKVDRVVARANHN